MITLADCFDHIFVINLPERTDRMCQVKSELSRMGVSFSRGQAERFEGIRPASADAFPSVGARGCFLSHLGVLKLAQVRGYQRALILEDDVRFTQRFREDPSPWLAQLAAHQWDWCYLGHRIESVMYEERGFVAYSGKVVTAHAYSVTGMVLVPLISYLEDVLRRPAGHPDGGPMHVDGAFSMYRARHPELRTLLAVPPVAVQRRSRSDIAPLRFWDRMAIVRSIAGWIRSVVE